MVECEKCGYQFNYNDPTSKRSYYSIEAKTEAAKGKIGKIVYCLKCAPFGNTKIPEKI